MQVMKKFLSVFLVCVMLLCSAPLAGFVGMEFPEFVFDGLFGSKAEASDVAVFEDGSLQLESDWSINETRNTIEVDVYFVDCIGLASWDLNVTYDASLLSIIDDSYYMQLGTDASIINWYSRDNRIYYENNCNDPGIIRIGGCFKEKLWTAEEFFADTENNVNSENFHYFKFRFIVNDPETFRYTDTEISISGEWAFREQDTYYLESFDANGYTIAHIAEIPPVTVVDSGDCGENLTWVLESDGKLTISGTGEMYDFDYDNKPWDIDGYPVSTVIIEDGVTSIGKNAFYNCTSLTCVSIPDDITSINQYAFGNCEALNTVYISDMTAWCNIDFKDVTSNPLYYGGNLYLNENLVTALIIPDGISTIQESAFYGCTSLNTVTIPDSVINIGANAFGNCTSLHTVTIPDSVINIGASAFGNCTSLHTVTIPDVVESIGFDAFVDTAYYNDSDNWDAGVLYIDNHLIAANDTIPGHVVIKEQTKTIAKGAFHGNLALTSVVIPDSVTIIEKDTFIGCENLSDITVKDGNMMYSSVEGVLYNKDMTVLLLYPINKTETTFVVPDGVVTIEEFAFANCKKLENIVFSDSVRFINNSAFASSNLQTADLSENTEIIAEWAFAESYLTSIEIPDSVTTIGDDAFYRCLSLENISLSKNVQRIGYYAFYMTPYYKDENNWTDGVLYIDDYLICARYDIDDPHIISSNTRVIADYAFEDCRHLSEIVIPANVSVIGMDAFRSTSVEKITIANPDCLIVDSANTLRFTASICGYENSTAQAYAEKYNRNFVSLGEAPSELFTDSETIILTNENIVSVAGATAAQLLSQAGDGAAVADKNGNALAADAKIGTGAVLTLADGTKHVVVVQGDADGDGAITSSDARSLLRYSVGLDAADAAQKLAADVDSDGRVSSSDARLALRASVGLEKPADWLTKIK